MRVGLIIYGSSYNDIHFVSKDSLEFNNTIHTCLIRVKIILFYFS